MLVSICLVIFCTIIWWFYAVSDINSLQQLPGPQRIPFIGNALQFVIINPDNLFQLLLKFTSQFGDRYVFKLLHLWALHISSPSDIEVVLSHSKNISKSLPYKFLQPWLGTGVLLATGSKWRNRRKILTPTFHFNILKSFFVIMKEKSRNLVTVLTGSNGKDVDILPVLSDFTLYTICGELLHFIDFPITSVAYAIFNQLFNMSLYETETAMGIQLDTDQSSAAVEYKNAIIKIGHIVINRVTAVWLHYDIIFNRTKLRQHYVKNLNAVNKFIEKVIVERQKQNLIQNDKLEIITENGSKKRLAMLDLLLALERRGEIDLEGIMEEVNTFMFGGHDTTAVALTFCLMLLADHEDVQQRAYEECRRMFAKCEGKPSMSDIAEMKYIEAVIKESLRLYPSVPMIGREIDEDFIMNGVLVKKGTHITIDLYSLHHHRDLYPQPEEFKPERFLNGEIRHPFAFLPFSAGLRNCIGQRYAMMQMKCFLYEIIRNFKLEPKIKGWRPNLTATIVLRPLEPVCVTFTPRME